MKNDRWNDMLGNQFDPAIRAGGRGGRGTPCFVVFWPESTE